MLEFVVFTIALLWLLLSPFAVQAARERGLDERLYGMLGIVFGPAGWVMALVGRPSPRRMERLLERVAFVGARAPLTPAVTRELLGEDGVEDFLRRVSPGFAVAYTQALAAGRTRQLMAAVEEEARRRLQLRERVLRVGIVASVGAAIAAALFLVATRMWLPTIASLFEGMNLTLPLPTKMMLVVERLMGEPGGAAAVVGALLALPVFVRMLGRRPGYWLPIQGGLLHAIDRQQLVGALRIACAVGAAKAEDAWPLAPELCDPITPIRMRLSESDRRCLQAHLSEDDLRLVRVAVEADSPSLCLDDVLSRLSDEAFEGAERQAGRAMVLSSGVGLLVVAGLAVVLTLATFLPLYQISGSLS